MSCKRCGCGRNPRNARHAHRARPSGTARSLTSPGTDRGSHARHWLGASRLHGDERRLRPPALLDFRCSGSDAPTVTRYRALLIENAPTATHAEHDHDGGGNSRLSLRQKWVLKHPLGEANQVLRGLAEERTSAVPHSARQIFVAPRPASSFERSFLDHVYE